MTELQKFIRRLRNLPLKSIKSPGSLVLELAQAIQADIENLGKE